MQAYSDPMDHNGKTDGEELNGGMGTRAMTSGHFPEKLEGLVSLSFLMAPILCVLTYSL